ncbi:DUF2017 domain-containing protein [Kineococcus rhizosphaerae]|uniref:Uncharacterized protein DUF2017 n=1 Tax=Kineococcus rhizosphaerae TaxID=559628 RepID=A0A2T0R407_9ACTN|nr:DUF2017 domain-containing protein [Kineococcus rhizosphaerae]PRY14723.1 uncharacterized protein DUF2017 [Kineococcus rhizosphaerae]
MATFRKSRHGLYSITLHASEADLLASLAREVVELLEVPEPPARPVDPLAAELGLTDLPAFDVPELGADGPVVPPEDEVLQRLLPDAYAADDPQASADFRRFTERGLRERKAAVARGLLATLDPVLGQGGRVQLDGDGARTWLAALNDIRLALGTRLGVREDGTDPYLELAEDDPARWAWAVYDFTTHLQETLVRSLL